MKKLSLLLTLICCLFGTAAQAAVWEYFSTENNKDASIGKLTSKQASSPSALTLEEMAWTGYYTGNGGVNTGNVKKHDFNGVSCSSYCIGSSSKGVKQLVLSTDGFIGKKITSVTPYIYSGNSGKNFTVTCKVTSADGVVNGTYGANKAASATTTNTINTNDTGLKFDFEAVEVTGALVIEASKENDPGGINIFGVVVEYVSVENPTISITNAVDNAVTLNIGETFTPTFTDGAETTLSISGAESADAAIATVDAATGEVTAVAAGSTTITYTTAEVSDKYNAGTATLNVTVVDPNAVTAPTFTQDNEFEAGKLFVGDIVTAHTTTAGATLTLSVTGGEDGVDYSITDSNVIFEKAGQYTVVATVKKGDKEESASLECAVSKKTAEIKPVAESMLLALDATDGCPFEVTVTPSTATAPVAYSTSDESIVMIDEKTGDILGAGLGTVTLTATIAETDEWSAATATITVEVLEKIQTNPVVFDFTNAEKDETHRYGMAFKPSGYNDDKLNIKSDDVIIVSNKGSGNGTRLWDDGLRIYQKSSLDVVAPTGYAIEKIECTGAAKFKATFEGSTNSQNISVSNAWLRPENYYPSNVNLALTGTSTLALATMTITLVELTPELVCTLVSGDQNGEGDAYTVAKGAQMKIEAKNFTPVNGIAYTVRDEKNLGGDMTDMTVPEDGVITFDKVGNYTYTFEALVKEGKMLTKEIFVIVKNNSSEITAGEHTLNFAGNAYGMTPGIAPADATHNFTGKNTGGLDLFIPAGSLVQLENAEGGQNLVVPAGSEFSIGIDNNGYAISEITITGTGLESLELISGAFGNDFEILVEDEMIIAEPKEKDGAAIRSFRIVGKAASNGPSAQADGIEGARISGISIATQVATGVAGVEADANAPVFYFDMQGRKVDAERLLPGLYIKVCGSKSTKEIVK